MAKTKKQQKVVAKAKAETPLNPFERRVNKPKFEIWGRKLKGAESNVGQSRARSIETRKQTLLVEYQQSGKNNKFIDNRIGEDDSNLSVEDKALIRFQKEAKRRYAKKNVFNLEDDEELTHLGTSIGEMENFDDYVPSDEEDEGNLNAKVVRDLHFGGFTKVDENSEERKKSRDEVMAEIIAKSKAARREKAKEKLAQEELTNQLDTDWQAIRGTMSGMLRDKDNEVKEKADEFDRVVRELAFEGRAQATDRTKTPEELAKEEKERLEKLEADRLRRMRGEELSDDDENSKKKATRRKNVEGSADALDDDFLLDMPNDPDSYANPVGMGERSDEEDNEEKSAEKDEENSEMGSEEDGEEDEEDEEEEDMEDLEEDSENDQQGEDYDEEEEEEQSKKYAKSSSSKKKKNGVLFAGAAMKGDSNEIPYTFNVPEDVEEFASWVDNRSAEDMATIVHRIRACNHISLDPNNKAKMQRFCSILLDYFFYLCSTTTTSDRIPLAEMDILTKALFELRETVQSTIGPLCASKIQGFHANLQTKLENRGKESCWPSIGHLLFFKLLSNIFPTSDFQHAVVTPTLLLLGEYLSQAPVKNGKEYSIALFICNLWLHYLSSSKRYCPEVIKFLTDSLTSIVQTKEKSTTTIPSGFLSLKETKKSKFTVQPLDFNALFAGMYKDKKEFFNSDNWRVNTINTIVQLAFKFAKLWFGTPAFKEIFAPISALLKNLPVKQYPEELKKNIASLSEYIATSGEKCIRSRKPLFQKQKPKEIKILNPRFHENYSLTKNYDADQERAKLTKLKGKMKKERKGAMRELRKDTSFVQSEKDKRKREEIEEREQKRRKIMAMLEQQQAEGKQLEKEKKNPKHKSAF